MSTTSQTPPPESSQPPDAEEPPSPEPIRWYNYWPKWRRVMMSGAVILLVGSLVNAVTDESWITDWVPNATFVVGYGLLAWGFWLAMSLRASKRNPSDTWTGTTKSGWGRQEGDPDQ